MFINNEIHDYLTSGLIKKKTWKNFLYTEIRHDPNLKRVV